MDAIKGCGALFYNFELPSDHPTYDVSFYRERDDGISIIIIV